MPNKWFKSCLQEAQNYLQYTTDRIPVDTYIISQSAEMEISFNSSQATPKCCPM